MAIIDIYGVGVLISGIAGIIFILKDDAKKAFISWMILIFILLLKYMGV